jgi:hypothetical protein
MLLIHHQHDEQFTEFKFVYRDIPIPGLFVGPFPEIDNALNVLGFGLADHLDP